MAYLKTAGSIAPERVHEFAQDVREYLSLAPRQLPSKYFYDELGTCLFEAICHLPWYRITHAEERLLALHARDIAGGLQEPVTLVELGCGSGEKLAVLAEALRGGNHPVQAHLIDISPGALDLSERTLGRLDHVLTIGHQSTYEVGLRRAAEDRQASGSMLVLFLGSNIGNFDPPVADVFLAEIRAALGPGDGLLLGADLVKPPRELILAYDDPLGVTAAFNKNLLRRINAELLADFDLRTFDHRAVWNARESRIEMHLISRVDQIVRIPGAGCTVSFAAGEPIWTESSYKYEPQGIVEMGEVAGFRCRAQWIDPDARFALTLFEVGNSR